MIGDNIRPEPLGSEGFRAHTCDILRSFMSSRNLNHKKRTLLGAILFQAEIPLNLATRLYSFQEDFKPLRTRRELKRIYRKRLMLPRCSTLTKEGLCRSYCGRLYPDVILCRKEVLKYSDVFGTPKISSPLDVRIINSIKEYYLKRFTISNVDCKFRFFKVETPDDWIKIRGSNSSELVNTIRRIVAQRPILGIYYSLGRFLSAKWAEKSRNYVLIDYIPVLDYDLHKQFKEKPSYQEQNQMLTSLLKEKITLLRQRGYQPYRILFTGGGFHFYIKTHADEAKKLAAETGADPIIDHKRVVRLERSLNVKYGDIRICGQVSENFNIYDHILQEADTEVLTIET